MALGNIYHTAQEEAIDLLKYRITEMEKLEADNLKYQDLIRFYYDIKSILSEC